MQMLFLAFTPRFVCYTLSILFAATLLLIIVVVPSSIYVAGIPLARVRFKVMRLSCRFENRGRLGIWRRRN